MFSSYYSNRGPLRENTLKDTLEEGRGPFRENTLKDTLKYMEVLLNKQSPNSRRGVTGFKIETWGDLLGEIGV